MFGLTIDPTIHDNQHAWASVAGGIVGLGIFVTYYFMSRMESIYAPSQKIPGRTEPTREYQWDMPWWYFVVGIIVFAGTGSAIGCMLSVANRPRTIHMKKKST
jgi:hypothetical protein